MTLEEYLVELGVKIGFLTPEKAEQLLKECQQIVRCKNCRKNGQCSIQFKFADADNPEDWFCGYWKWKEGSVKWND